MKIVLAVFSLFFFCLLGTAPALAHEHEGALPNEETVLNESDTSTESAEIVEDASSYTLAYPGMLPDSPLYKIKVLRDKIIAFLINEPLKKVDFYLLQADKGIQASAMLVEKDNQNLASETALKAEHNMTLIVTQLTRLQNKPEGNLFGRLQEASEKHQEVLMQLIENTEGEAKKELESALEFSKRNLETIERYSKKDPKKWTDWS